ncbi:hypothetical protein GGTG_02092 [Gaeumannomyces tritici R3-111a-1]|uniref:Uncharacterized protein n=1 Tax=Gaeumannomyces tritici (strain R3-111a-1) TaxID=644352 RepID=J3NLE3_GAET3|nr:hypothetical protein GGTG_02092 [Gaeumannomyces tritici R3-111a-1]EJT82118.1 hypothetical protein GGTG_02092 [Gaeumannomyces tritici R3-111a-1]
MTDGLCASLTAGENSGSRSRPESEEQLWATPRGRDLKVCAAETDKTGQVTVTGCELPPGPETDRLPALGATWDLSPRLPLPKTVKRLHKSRCPGRGQPAREQPAHVPQPRRGWPAGSSLWQHQALPLSCRALELRSGKACAHPNASLGANRTLAGLPRSQAELLRTSRAHPPSSGPAHRLALRTASSPAAHKHPPQPAPLDRKTARPQLLAAPSNYRLTAATKETPKEFPGTDLALALPHL